jgi:16S rRNA (cytosine967-C5)-methyltransferase
VRAVAARVIHAVVAQGKSLDDALAFAEARNRFDPRDASLLRALSYGVLRHHRRLGWQLERLLDTPLADAGLVDALLRTGLYQLFDLRIPDYAASAATTAAAEMLDVVWARSLINAVMRRAQREPERLQPPQDTRIRESFPDWLDAAVREDWGDAANSVLEASNWQAPMTLRVHHRRMPAADYVARLATRSAAARLIDGAADAVVLETPMAVEVLPGFERGSVSVQDASAQLAADLLAPEPGQRVLDACAAPGGKSAHLLERFPSLVLTAIDSDSSRLQRVDETLRRVGVGATLIGADAADTERWWDGKPFDRILIDAPCSGTGVIRRHPDIKWLRRDTDITAMAETQGRLLEALWPLLAPGGRLVFATCSILRAEGRGVVESFLQRRPQARALPISLPVGEADGPGWRIPPGGDWDGFFYAALGRD